MITSASQRGFNMPNADLINYSNNLIGFLTRDLSDLSDFGVTAIAITDLQTLKESFADFPTDEEFIGDVGIATQTKNEVADRLRLAIRNITVRAENKWGTDSFRYKKFGVMGMNKFNDRDLYVCAKRVHNVATGFLAELASEGLTTLILDDFKDIYDSFEVTLFNLNEAMANRDKNTEERVNLGNDLYSKVVKYTNIGKQVFENTSEAKYNDYIIYSAGATGVPPKIQGLAFEPDTLVVSWIPSDPASDTYQVETSTDGSSWSLYYEDAAAQFTYGVAPATYYARCRGINKHGNGAWSDTLEIVIGLRKPHLLEVGYDVASNLLSVVWDGVPYSQNYEVWQSVVAVGQPAGTFSLITHVVPPIYEHLSPTHGTREYYYVIAKNATLTSAPSNTMYVDVVAPA